MKPAEPRQHFVFVKAQQPAKLEVRDHFEAIHRMLPRNRSWPLSAPTAACPAKSTVGRPLINPTRPHVQKVGNLLDGQNLGNHHEKPLRKE
jgi:hypothetical protein